MDVDVFDLRCLLLHNAVDGISKLLAIVDIFDSEFEQVAAAQGPQFNADYKERIVSVIVIGQEVSAELIEILFASDWLHGCVVGTEVFGFACTL